MLPQALMVTHPLTQQLLGTWDEYAESTVDCFETGFTQLHCVPT